MTFRRTLRACADPFAHGLLAGAVAAPLAQTKGRGPLVTAVVAGTVIDLDHVVAARSLRPVAWWTLGGGRPRAHTLVLAVGLGGVAAVVAGPVARVGGLRRPGLAPAARRQRRRRHADPVAALGPAADPARGLRRRHRRARARVVAGQPSFGSFGSGSFRFFFSWRWKRRRSNSPANSVSPIDTTSPRRGGR